MAPEKGLVDVCESVSGFTALSHRPLSCNSILTGVLHFLWHSEPPHPFLPPPLPISWVLGSQKGLQSLL